LFRKVLVANRGEIAVRVIRACRELGVRTVAVYSEADKDALHVRLADEAYPIGPASARQSYLNIPNLMNAVSQSGADAVHPGYGFLSENASFAQVCDVWGVTFIGPRPDAIAKMGVKSVARDTVAQAGVPVIPGSEGVVTDFDEARRIAERIGYPVMVKAAAGGGGRGIRVAEDEAALRESLERAAQEAKASFGEGSLYLEKFLVNPRHVEVQVFADRTGRVVALGERECSVQRRRQKLVEEAPSPAVTPALRRAMAEAACRAAAAVGYENAGTVEFLLDEDGRFYFIEMNTRIQVEHGVTELVTGVDLVKLQILVAAGEPLPFAEDLVAPVGHAIECRINAEDPAREFRPSPGTITVYEPPGGPGVRLDAGVVAGSTISPFYDSLVAKLMTWGRDREEARRRMVRALGEFRVEGIHTTIPMHLRLMADEDFVAGAVHTNWLEGRLPALLER
jgi:acetyl-CoA carboxylase biotin carboxylase subunit